MVSTHVAVSVRRDVYLKLKAAATAQRRSVAAVVTQAVEDALTAEAGDLR